VEAFGVNQSTVAEITNNKKYCCWVLLFTKPIFQWSTNIETLSTLDFQPLDLSSPSLMTTMFILTGTGRVAIHKLSNLEADLELAHRFHYLKLNQVLAYFINFCLNW
jgi:hypothetical protein